MNETQIEWARRQSNLIKALEEDISKLTEHWGERPEGPITLTPIDVPKEKIKIGLFTFDIYKSRDARTPVVLNNPIPAEMVIRTLQQAYEEELWTQKDLLEKAEEKDFTEDNCYYGQGCHPQPGACKNCSRFKFHQSAVDHVLGLDPSKDRRIWLTV